MLEAEIDKKKDVPKDDRTTISVLCDNRGEQEKHAFLPKYMSEQKKQPHTPNLYIMYLCKEKS